MVEQSRYIFKRMYWRGPKGDSSISWGVLDTELKKFSPIQQEPFTEDDKKLLTKLDDKMAARLQWVDIIKLEDK